MGNDVEDGKVTLPVLWTYAQASESVRASIRDAYTLPVETSRVDDPPPSRAGQLRSVCDLGPGVEYATARAGELTCTALGRLAELAPSAARDSLESLGEFVLERRW